MTKRRIGADEKVVEMLTSVALQNLLSWNGMHRE